MDDNKYVKGCCCDIYSFSLLGSNDNITWTTIHTARKEEDLYSCKHITFDFAKTIDYKFLRFMQDEPYPGCEMCMAINQVEFYGTTVDHRNGFDYDDSIEDETVSIIGKIKRNE